MNELKQKIVDLCNSSGLPLEALIFILKDIWRDAEDTLRKLEEVQKQQQEDKEE